jgi:purine catabolism regulator
VLAGKAGLNREVSLVTVGEVPDIGNWLTGNELVLSTFFATDASPEAQADFTRKIVNAGAAGLIVKPGRFIEVIGPDIVALGDENDFPVIEVPEDVRWTHITAEISERIVGEHIGLLRRSQEIHSSLLDVVIGGGSWQSIADTAAQLLERPVLLENSYKEVLAKSVPDGMDAGVLDELESAGAEEAGDAGRDEPARNERFIRHAIGGNKHFSNRVTLPVAVSGDILGYVSTFENKSPLNELDLEAVEGTATVAAVEMGRELARLEAETRLRGDFLDDLLAGEFDAGPTMLQRASYLGGDLSKGCMALVADIDDFGEYVMGQKLSEPEVQRVKNRYFSKVKQIIRAYHQDALVTPRSDNVIAFLPPVGDDATKLMGTAHSTASRIRNSCRELFPDFTVSVGLGRFHGDPAGTGRAYREAQTALQVSQRLGETGNIASFDDMGIYKLLLSAMEEDPVEIQNFYDETIAKIVIYDKEHKTDLVGTLETFLANNRSIAVTAEAMFTHRHTIRYRLGRIHDLTGLDVNKSEDQEKLGFGLKAMRLLRRGDS